MVETFTKMYLAKMNIPTLQFEKVYQGIFFKAYVR